MSPTASSIYAFCESAHELELRRIEVASPAFAALRRSVRRLVEILRDDPASLILADAIQHSLLQWLSVPMPFPCFEMSHLIALGSPGSLEQKWGRDARRLFVEACDAFTELSQGENPLRAAVEDALLDAVTSSGAVRIWSHRTARPYFESLTTWRELRDAASLDFLGSARDYRSSAPFGSLLKVGPLRSHGFSSLPNAVINAPRYHTLLQIVWYGTPDEQGFGADPVLASWTPPDGTSCLGSSVAGQGTALRRSGAVVGDVTVRTVADSIVEDDFSSKGRGSMVTQSRRAVLLHLAEGLGCLQAPHADIVCVGVHSDRLFALRLEPSDIDSRFTHLVDPALEHVDFGALHASVGRLAPKWKAKLLEEYSRSPTDLEEKLRSRGIELETLPSRIREWTQPSMNVIKAPQQRRHFEILVEVLGIEADALSFPRSRNLSWAAAGWTEIAHSRGEAIQHGTERQEIISEELRRILETEGTWLREQLKVDHSFTWVIPPGHSLSGSVRLHAILEIETGFRCPEQLLKTIGPIEELLSWRE